MTDGGMADAADDEEIGREWRRLLAAQIDLRLTLADTEDPDARTELIDRIMHNRVVLRAIEGRLDNPTVDPVDPVDPVDRPADPPNPAIEIEEQTVASTSGDDDPPTPEAAFPAPGRPEAEPDPGPGPEPGRRGDRRGRWPLVAGALALAAVIAVGLWLLLGRDDERAATARGEVAGQPDGSDDDDRALQRDADAVRGQLARLGFSGLEVSVVDPTIYVAGTVATEQDRSTIRSALVASVGGDRLDLTGIVVDPVTGGPGPGPGPGPGQQPGGTGPGGPMPGAPPPGAPPPGFVPPTEEQRAALQDDLDRVLAMTPLVFDVGSTELNELQRQTLDTVIRPLLEAHPGVPVRLVGYTDGTGPPDDNDLLSLARAIAVQEYLVSTGVPEFILRVEGRGAADASGDASRDRRVEIEVVDGPYRP